MVTVAAPAGLRARRKAQTHREITEAAVDLFERQGFDATTVEEIALTAGVSPRTFFRYFESKVEILLPATGAVENDHVEGLVAARPASETALEALHHVLRDTISRILEDDELVVRQYRLLLSTPTLRSLALEHFHQSTEGLTRIIGERLGEAPDALEPQIMAAAVSAVMWRVLEHWVAEGARRDRLVPLFDEALELLKAGLR